MEKTVVLQRAAVRHVVGGVMDSVLVAVPIVPVIALLIATTMVAEKDVLVIFVAPRAAPIVIYLAVGCVTKVVVIATVNRLVLTDVTGVMGVMANVNKIVRINVPDVNTIVPVVLVPPMQEWTL